MTTTMKTSRVQLFKGVHNPEKLLQRMKSCTEGNHSAKSYIQGSLQYLERHPPNRFVVPFLRRVLGEFGRR